jgi:hypothetical protein
MAIGINLEQPQEALDINRHLKQNIGPNDKGITPCKQNCKRKKCMFCGPRIRNSHVKHYRQRTEFRERSGHNSIIFSISKKGTVNDFNKFIRTMKHSDKQIEWIAITENIPSRHVHGIFSTNLKPSEIKKEWRKISKGVHIDIKKSVGDATEKWLNYMTKQAFNQTNAPLDQPLSKIRNSRFFAYNGKKARAERREWIAANHPELLEK